MADGLVEEHATFFDNILVLVNESERHYGYSNTQFAEYIIERFHYSINSCNFIHEALTEAAFPVLEDYSSNLQKLIECLKGYCLSAMDRLRGCFGVLLWSFSFLSGAARGKAKYKLYWKASVCYNKRSTRLFVIAQL